MHVVPQMNPCSSVQVGWFSGVTYNTWMGYEIGFMIPFSGLRALVFLFNFAPVTKEFSENETLFKI